MFIARDKNNNLCIYNSKPIKNGDYWSSNPDNDPIKDIDYHYDYLQIDSALFPKLKWEDEPLEIGLLPVDLSYLESVTPEQECEYLNSMPFHCRVCSNAACLIPKGSEACTFYEEREKWYQNRK